MRAFGPSHFRPHSAPANQKDDKPLHHRPAKRKLHTRFARYNIVVESDLVDAAATMAAYRKGRNGPEPDPNSDKNRDSVPETPTATGSPDGR